MVCGGVRVGTAALTTRGMKEAEMQQVGAWILRCLKAASDDTSLSKIRHEIAEFAKAFPVPGIE